MHVALLTPPLNVPPNLQSGYQRLLGETAHLLLQDSDADTLCRTIFETLQDSFRLDSYAHYLVSPDGVHLHLASSGGDEAVRAALGPELHFGEAVCGHVATTHQPIYLPGIQQRSDEMTRLVRECGVCCYVCQPLMAKGNFIGTLSFGSHRRSEFLAEEVELFGLITQQVRVATERRLQNEHLRKLEQLAAAGRMCATLAHEINNPLASLSNFLYLLGDDMESVEGSEYLALAKAEVERLAEITRRTLKQFRHDEQKPERVSLSEMADEVLAHLSLPNRIQVKKLILNELMVEAIPGELRQVLFNLPINAAQFSPPDREVTLTVLHVGECAHLVVRDEGKGISESGRSKLFQPFYTTRGEQGTGIGLWISREMVERVGGKLECRSNPELSPGTEFIVMLPLSATA